MKKKTKKTKKQSLCVSIWDSSSRFRVLGIFFRFPLVIFSRGRESLESIEILCVWYILSSISVYFSNLFLLLKIWWQRLYAFWSYWSRIHVFFFFFCVCVCVKRSWIWRVNANWKREKKLFRALPFSNHFFGNVKWCRKRWPYSIYLFRFMVSLYSVVAVVVVVTFILFRRFSYRRVDPKWEREKN